MRLTSVLLLAAALPTPGQVPGPARIGSEDPRRRGPAYATSQPAEFAWLMFLNLVSPAKPNLRGIPDPSKSIGTPAATVFETWRDVSTIYLADGSRPRPWNTQWELPVPAGGKLTPTKADFAALGPVDSTYVHFLSEPVMIDGQNIVTDQNRIVHYDVRDNHAAFDYIVNNRSGFELFNLDGQQQALTSAKFTFAFPADAMEIKASWRILAPGDDTSRMWTAYVVYYDLQNSLIIARAGLTGLHFKSKILPNWFWATFEQVDNPTDSYTWFLRKKGAAVGPNLTYNSAATPANTSFDTQLEGTKWGFYKLMGWQTDFVDASNNPTLLANTQMETYFQNNSSCITCHDLANIGPQALRRLDMWNTANNNITGFTGKVDFAQFAASQSSLKFKQMDYVWSLRQAKARQTSPHPPAQKGAK